MGWIASSRPSNFLFNLCSDGLHIVFTGSTPELKAIRKAIATFFSRQNAAKRSPIKAESAQLLYELMDNPSEFRSSVRRFTHSAIKTLVYGQRAAFFNSQTVTEFYESMDEISRINSPGVYPPIDLIPILKYLPAKLVPWHAPARAVERVRRRINEELYDNVLKKMRKDESELEAEPEWKCWTEWMIETCPELEREFVSYTGLVLMDGGSDTSGAYLLSLILALASNPEYQERAWKEVDAVVGGRIPERADLEDLPFVQALIKEILRLRSPFTMGFPHSMAEDVFYKGHVLPKGSTVMLNNYAISTDPEVFEDPEAFKPERFLMTEFGTIPGRDKNFRDSFIFGGGRRICPGQFVAQYTAELITMHLIWALHFKDAIDAKTKKRIAPGLSADHYDFELVVSPRPFECSITPRPERAQMLKENFFAATGELQKYEIDLEESDKQRLRELRARLS
ncbi:cytochrome P450 [Hymenopellis radicata]|nr:cytochrome P450 [Hymenopellis radicata]